MSYQTYYQPPPSVAPYYPPPPPVDPFRAYYADRLRELTFNSRPLIQDLSIQALQQRDQNQWERMKMVVEELEAAVLRAPPHQKLPLLYLIDSISKNIGTPYTTHLLPPVIPRLYLRTYREVDGVTKSKMEEMMGLWRNSGVGGGELYPPGVRESIEREIFGTMPPVPPPSHVQNFSPALPPPPAQTPSFPTQQQVQLALNATLELKHRQAAANPYDRTASTQVGALIQIGELLNSRQVPPAELQQIMEQLKGMGSTQPRSIVNVVPPTPLGPIMPPAPNLPPFPPSLPREQYRPTPPLGQIPMPAVPTPPQLISTPIPSNATPLPNNVTVPAPALPDNFADMLRNLTSSGILSTPRTPEHATTKLEPVKPKSSLDIYEDMILSMDVRLESLDLNQMHTLPTSHLPVRCKQCGMRFPDGDNKLQAHMDWHFRRNRKERESEGRGAHRRWLPRAEDWINDVPEAGPSTQSPSKSNGNGQTLNSAGQPTKLTAERLAALQKKWVRVPLDSVKAVAPCPVCKEMFKAEWSEDEEEWIWRNAVEVNGTIYHATCRAESLSSAVAARLLSNAEPRARSASKSPARQVAELPKVEPGSEKKRKMEDGAQTGVQVEQGNGAKRVKIEPGIDGAEVVVDLMVFSEKPEMMATTDQATMEG